MTEQSREERKDDVLFAFHCACERPTAEQIIEWVDRYPEFAEEIREHAALLRDWADQEENDPDEIDETLLSRANSRVLNAVYNAQVAAKEGHEGGNKTFDALLAAAGTSTPALARELDVDRSVLADLFRGRIERPIGDRLVSALIVRLKSTQTMFENALSLALSSPSMGLAKSVGPLKVVRRSYDEVIRDSNMTPERKDYWLGKD